MAHEKPKEEVIVVPCGRKKRKGSGVGPEVYAEVEELFSRHKSSLMPKKRNRRRKK